MGLLSRRAVKELSWPACLTGVTLITATASAATAYLVFQATLPAGALTGTSLSDPGVARAVVGGGSCLTLLALRSFGRLITITRRDA